MKGFDLLSLFLEDTETFDDEKIMNNIIGFIFAATETTHFASQTCVTHLTQSPESVAKARAEFKKVILEPALLEDPSIADLPEREMLNKVVTSDAVLDLEYATHIMQETLRFRPSAGQGFIFYCKEDVKLGKYNFKKDDMFDVNFAHMGYNTEQW